VVFRQTSDSTRRLLFVLPLRGSRNKMAQRSLISFNRILGTAFVRDMKFPLLLFKWNSQDGTMSRDTREML